MAILREAGPKLQEAILREARVAQLDPGSLVVTDGFNLTCQKVFHTVCPPWSASGQAKKVSYGPAALTSAGSSARLTCERSVPDFNIHHQPMSEGGRKAEDEVTVLPRHRDGRPGLPQRGGGQNPAEGGPDLQPQENTSAPEGGVHRGSPQRQQDGERECMKKKLGKLPQTGYTGPET